jgi:prevent-host-death family protein
MTRPSFVMLVKDKPMSATVTVHDARTQLSSLLDRAADGEEIIITRNGVPRARLVPVAFKGERRRPSNAMKISYIAPDFDAPDPETERQFNGDDA